MWIPETHTVAGRVALDQAGRAQTIMLPPAIVFEYYGSVVIAKLWSDNLHSPLIESPPPHLLIQTLPLYRSINSDSPLSLFPLPPLSPLPLPLFLPPSLSPSNTPQLFISLHYLPPSFYTFPLQLFASLTTSKTCNRKSDPLPTSLLPSPHRLG